MKPSSSYSRTADRVGARRRRASRRSRLGRASESRPASTRGRPEPVALEVGVDGDDVDLAERRVVVGVHLGPAEAGQAPVALVEQEAGRVEPRLALAGRASVSTVQPPCSGWPAKARLLTSSQASSSWPGTNGRVVELGRPRRPAGGGASGAGRGPGARPGARAQPRRGRGPAWVTHRWTWPPPSSAIASSAPSTQGGADVPPRSRWWGSTTSSTPHAPPVPADLGVADGGRGRRPRPRDRGEPRARLARGRATGARRAAGGRRRRRPRRAARSPPPMSPVHLAA